MNKTLKIIAINLFILITGLLLIELILGGWFRNKNKIKNLNVIISAKYTYDCDLYSDTNIKIQYTRDDFGLRGGGSFNRPEEINILTVGGSTTDQRYINDGETWQDIIENCYKAEGSKVILANAGVDGQSTFGHIKNFQNWFNNIPNLKPEYIVFYIGINDFYRTADNSSFDMLDDSNFKKTFKDNSIFYNFYQTYRNWRKAISYGLGHKKVSFPEFTYVEKGVAPKELYTLYDKNIIGFENRIKKLAECSRALGAEPIFVSQPCMMFKINNSGIVQGVSETSFIEGYPYNGIDYYHLLNRLNDAMYKICKDNFKYIDLTNAPVWDEKDFYDFFHNTPSGAKKIGEMIYEKIKNQ